MNLAPLGLVLVFNAQPGRAVVRIDGLNISGSVGVRANTLGEPVNETVQTPAGPVHVTFATGDDELSFAGSVVMSVAGVFEISGDISATKMSSGRVLVDIPQVGIALDINGLRVFDLGGKARFAIGGADGFQLLDIGLTQVSVLGIDVSAIAGELPSLLKPNAVPLPAELTTIVDGIDDAVLNRRKYLDLTLQSPGNAPLDPASVLDASPEFTLSGAGLADAVIDHVEHLEGNTFRYFLRDRDTTNDVDLFRPGSINVNFVADSWADDDGATNAASSDSFNARDGAASTSDNVNLGPLVLNGPHIGLEDLQFKPLFSAGGGLLGARITITVGIGVEHAELNFGGSSSAVSTSVDRLLALFDVNVDIDPQMQIVGGGLGKFSISADEFSAEVKDVLEATATGIVIGFDPEKDKDNDGTVSASEQAAYDSQTLLQLQTASVTITPISLTGALREYTRNDGTTIPGLVVRSNGEVFIASGGAALFPGKSFSMTFKDGPDANTEAVRAGLAFSNGVPSGFKFSTDLMAMNLGSFLQVQGEDIEIDTTATGDTPMACFGAMKAVVQAGSLKLGGELREFGFLSDGTFQTYASFGMFLSAEALSGNSIKWPSWLPIQITEVGIQWRNINAHPERFSLIVSAVVTELKAVPKLTFSGAVKGIRIDLRLLADGEFPITDIESIGVGVKGELFGANVEGALIGGIVKLDSNGNEIGTLESR